jgi:hypothetical protein
MKLKNYITEAIYTTPLKDEAVILKMSEKLLDFLEKKEKSYSNSSTSLQYKDYWDEYDEYSLKFYREAIGCIRDIKDPLERLITLYKEVVVKAKRGRGLTD